MTAYKVPIENGMRFRHGSRVELILKSGRRVLEHDTTPVEYLGGAITVLSIIYGAGITGTRPGWTDARTNLPLAERPKLHIRARREDILTDGALCECTTCLPTLDGDA